MTGELLLYLIEHEGYAPVLEQIGTEGIEITAVRRFSGGPVQEEGTFWLLSAGDWKDFSNSLSDSPALFAVTGWNSEKTADIRRQDTAAFFNAPAAPEELWTRIGVARHDFSLWRESFAEEILKGTPEREIYRKGRRYLPWFYMVVGVDMDILYGVPDAETLRAVYGLEKVPARIPEDDVQVLMLSHNFHRCAKEKEPFDYVNETMSDQDGFRGYQCICRNLFRPEDGSYAARVVMLPKGSVSLHPGAREVFRIFTDQLQMLYDYGKTGSRARAKDQLHQLCRLLAAGETAEKEVIDRALAGCGWKRGDDFLAVSMHYYTQEGWDTQKETTIAYLRNSLERGWKESCAVDTGQEVIWVVNATRSGFSADLHDFHQKAAAFVRDHICMAGVSPRFDDFLLLEGAVRTARAALTIGRRENPSFWYYIFDTCRLTYMIGKMREEIPPELLEHPAVTALKKYDGKYNTELAKTLEAWLACSGNVSQAADSIYVHRTTFTRRMEHIRKLTGLSLTDPDELLSLTLSFRLRG